MAFRLRRKESVEEGFRRIALEEIGQTLEEIAAQTLPRDEIVHEARKHCKKLRGLIRLVRPAFQEPYSLENAWFRDASRELSAVRDADVLLETYDNLVARQSDEMDLAALGAIRAALQEHRSQVAEESGDVGVRLAQFAAKMREAQKRAASWTLSDSGFQVVGAGLRQNYARGRRAMQTAYADPTPENFHEWRKRVKYHWYHMRLLAGLWKQEMAVRRDAADYLSDLLGVDHDLVVLRGVLSGGAYGIDAHSETVETMIAQADAWRRELQATSHLLGKRLYAEKPSRLVNRLHAYWQTWRKKGKTPERATA